MPCHLIRTVYLAALLPGLLVPAAAVGAAFPYNRTTADPRKDQRQRLVHFDSLEMPVSAAPPPVSAADGWTWLAAHQNVSGSWGGTYEFVDTCTVLEALRMYDPQAPALAAGAAWLTGQVPRDHEELARQIATLLTLDDQASNALQLVRQLLAARNPVETDDTLPNWPEGGWGLAPGYATDCMTTAVALLALQKAGLANGLTVQDQPVTSSTADLHEFDVPAGAVRVRIYVETSGVAVRVRTRAGSPPPSNASYVQVAKDSSQLILLPDDGPELVPGRNYISVTRTGGGTGSYSVHVSCETLAGDSRAIWDPYNTAGNGHGALDYLLRAQNADGGWGLQKGSDSELYTTLHVLLALQGFAHHGLTSQLASAIDYVKAVQLLGGGFGYDGTPLPYVTALAGLALIRNETRPYSTAVDNVVAALHAMQSDDGSWDQEPYDTALALVALWEQGLSPTADAGPDQSVLDAGADYGQLVTLAGTATDPDDNIVRQIWSQGDKMIAEGPTPTVRLDRGRHVLRFTVTDADGRTASDTVTVTVHGPYESFYLENMDTDPGWTTQGQWAWGVPRGNGGDHGGADPTSGYTGTTVYGYNLDGGYANNMSARYLTTTAIDCSQWASVQLRFRRWLCIEGSEYDHASVQVSNNPADAGSWVTVWDHAGGDLVETAWSLQEYDISAIADGRPAVYIRWCMGPTDVGWTWGGWNIDDVELVGGSIRSLGALADIDGDGQVNVFDVFVLAESWNTQAGDPAYNPRCDLDFDGYINVFDIFVLAEQWQG